MAQNSKIEWTDHTANLWHGCTKVHEGCDNCYAETQSHRWGNDLWGNDKPRLQVKKVWDDLRKFQQLAEKADDLHRVFVGSMMDIFEKPMSVVDGKGNPVLVENTPIDTGYLRAKLFNAIDKGEYPNLIFLLLTKRPRNINKYIPEHWQIAPPLNVMFGTSPVNQKTADTLVPQLLEAKGHKFLSIEPQLGPIELNDSWFIRTAKGQIDWVIQGGESGPGKRPFDLDWAKSMRAYCKFRVPYFFKQIDKKQPIPEELNVRFYPEHIFLAIAKATATKAITHYYICY